MLHNKLGRRREVYSEELEQRLTRALHRSRRVHKQGLRVKEVRLINSVEFRGRVPSIRLISRWEPFVSLEGHQVRVMTLGSDAFSEIGEDGLDFLGRTFRVFVCREFLKPPHDAR